MRAGWKYTSQYIAAPVCFCFTRSAHDGCCLWCHVLFMSGHSAGLYLPNSHCPLAGCCHMLVLQVFSPEEISAVILTKMKDTAENQHTHCSLLIHVMLSYALPAGVLS
jgi:hypothetical protein